MPIIFERMAFGAPSGHPQHAVQTIERLKHTLLIHPDYGCMLCRLHVQPDHVGVLLFEVGVAGAMYRSESMGLQPRLRQTRCTVDLLNPSADATFRQVQCVQPSVGRYGSCACTEAVSRYVAHFLYVSGAVRPSLLFESLLPAGNRRTRRMQVGLELIPAFSIGQCQNEAALQGIAYWQCSRLRSVGQFFAILQASFQTLDDSVAQCVRRFRDQKATKWLG